VVYDHDERIYAIVTTTTATTTTTVVLLVPIDRCRSNIQQKDPLQLAADEIQPAGSLL
jgi:hypothetical protein